MTFHETPISELPDVTCRMQSCITCHPTQVNVPRFNFGQTGQCTIYMYLSLRGYRGGLPIGVQVWQTCRPYVAANS